MKNTITIFSKVLASLMVMAMCLLAGNVVQAQNKECNAGFELKTDGYKITAKSTSSQTTGTEYLWSFGDNTTAHNSVAEHTFQKPGVYVVCLIVRREYKFENTTRRCADTVCKQVEIKEPCRLEIGFGVELKGTVANLKSEVKSNLNDLVYKWEFGNGQTSDRPNPEFDFKQPGTYKVCLTVASRDGRCRETICKTIEVKRDPCSELEASYKFEIDGNNVGFVSTTKGQNLVYEWTVDGRKVSEKESFRFEFKEPGRYTVCLVVKIKGTDCVKRICKVVEIKRPDPCAKLKVEFKYRINNSGKALFIVEAEGKDLVYEWTVNGRKVSEREGFMFQFRESGRYTVCVTVKIKGTDCVKRICKEIEVKLPEPCRLQAAFRYEVNEYKVLLHNMSKGTNLSYSWVIDGQRVSDLENYIAKLSPGKHRICLYISNRDGRCKDSYCTEIEIKRPNHREQTGGNKGHSLVADNTTATPEGTCNCGTEQTAQNAPVVEITLFPNPAQEVLNLTVGGVETAEIVISNANGVMYYKGQYLAAHGPTLEIAIAHLPQGYYVAKVISTDGKGQATLKFYKQ